MPGSAARRKLVPLSTRVRRRSSTIALFAPSLVAVGFVVIVPLALMFVRSFYEHVPASEDRPALVWSNYAEFVSGSVQRAIMARTLIMGLAVAGLALLLAFPCAYVLSRSSSRVRAVGLLIILVPLMTSVVVRSYGWMILLANDGPFAAVFRFFGIRDLKLMYTSLGSVIALTQVLLPFMVMSLFSVMQQIDPRLEEAVQSLGGGMRHVFRDVLWPLSRPGVAAGTLLVYVLAISAYATPLLVGGSGGSVMATYIFTTATVGNNWPQASAAAFILLGIVVLLTSIQSRLLGRRS